MTTKQIDIPIKIDHIARIEGKAGVEVIVENEKVKEIKVNVFEGPRFFEAIALGKPIDEATAIFPRVCSFCAAAHKITAIQAAEKAMQITPSKQTKMLRELMYLGDQIESHTLHLFLLALPDFLGFPDAFSMAKEHSSAVKTALELKDVGAKIQTLLGSRFMHQENAIIGGFGKLPTKNSLNEIKLNIKSLLKDSELALELFLPHKIWSEVSSERTHLALKPYGNSYGVFGDDIKASDDTIFAAEKYRENIVEKVVPHSFAKHSLFKNKPFMTGALSRITLFGNLLNGRAAELASTNKEVLDSTNPMANNFAQAIELVYFMEKALLITEDLLENLKENEKIKKIKLKEPGIGVSITEAPRGLLAYTLEVDKNGLVTQADIITPTAMFLPQLEADLKKEAEALLQTGKSYGNVIQHRLQTIVRAYDPCVSCSVHVTGVKK
ncbi:MAG TPA: Ni/Fe hydrogenase subunit alpha [candidate division Zixibacteria bacterium]|nr:Ni/Fe hydrogenase subunit alpha [candidate division Zixibacteria bacterium]